MQENSIRCTVLWLGIGVKNIVEVENENNPVQLVISLMLIIHIFNN